MPKRIQKDWASFVLRIPKLMFTWAKEVMKT